MKKNYFDNKIYSKMGAKYNIYAFSPSLRKLSPVKKIVEYVILSINHNFNNLY